MPEAQIREFATGEQLAARSLFTAGFPWSGVMLRDDICTVDYLCQRPEVDKRRLGCVGLSVGGYRSPMLAALAQRSDAGGSLAVATEVALSW